MNPDTQDLDYLKSLTLLYVEDDEDTSKQFCKLLQRLVGTVVSKKNGAEGLVAFHAHHPDIIIADIHTPVMDGLFMAKEIRLSDSSIPIIIITAFNFPDYIRRATSIGIDRYLVKPIDSQLLVKILNDLAHRLRKKRLSE